MKSPSHPHLLNATMPRMCPYLVASCIVLAGCVTLPSFRHRAGEGTPGKVSAEGLSAWKDESPRDYLAGAEDILDVQVHDHPDISGTYTIQSDGSMPFPLLVNVKAGGKTVITIAKEIAAALDKDFIVSPVVSVTVAEHRSQAVLVQGDVNKPGTYYLKGNTRLLDILSEADGIAPAEGQGQRGSRVRVIRGGHAHDGRPNGGVMIRTFDLDAILERGDVEANPILRAGDVVFLPEQTGIYVMGEAGTPQMVPFEKGLTVLKAIVLAGGTTEYGTLRGLTIRRVKDGKETSIKADVDSKLEPGDIVVVPRGIF